MPVPGTFADISEMPSSNSPQGTENVGPNANDYLQTAFAFIKMLYDGQQLPTNDVPMNGKKLTGMADGTAATDAATYGQLAPYLANLTTAFSTTSTVTVTNNGTGAVTVKGAGVANICLWDTTSNRKKFIRIAGDAFQIINNAYTNTPMSMDDAGNVTFSGNVGGYSDERLKKDWKELAPDFVERLADLKSGTFTRVDIEKRQAGVSAQSLQKLLPEVVNEESSGMLSVAYGQAALVAAIELAKEVRELRKRLADLEQS